MLTGGYLSDRIASDRESMIFLLLFAAVLLFSLFAQYRVRAVYKRYRSEPNARRIDGAETARRILADAGITDVGIERVPDMLSDHYDRGARVIRLSDDVYSQCSVAAIGIAAHEAGHVLQYEAGYAPASLRSAIVGVTQFASRWSVWFLTIGLLFNGPILARIGFFLYAVVAFFQLITLPVEFDASRRAMQALERCGIADAGESEPVKQVLGAAAMTYVAALASALVQLYRFWRMISGGSRK